MAQSCAVGKIEVNLWLVWEGTRLPFTAWQWSAQLSSSSDRRKCTSESFSSAKEFLPEVGGPGAEIKTELDESVFERQRDEVSAGTLDIAIVEDETVA